MSFFYFKIYIPLDANAGRDECDETGAPRPEAFEVCMHFTDDFLLMVLSFLDHINLGRAGMVCRQWRVASSHEDFWRCLNFENRNISLEQLLDMLEEHQQLRL